MYTNKKPLIDKFIWLFVPMILVFAFKNQSIGEAIVVNRVFVTINSTISDNEFDNSTLWAIGLPTKTSPHFDWSVFNNIKELPNLNWDYSWLAPWAEKNYHDLANFKNRGSLSHRYVRLQARMALLSGHPEYAITELNAIMSQSACDDLDQNKTNCFPLWIDVGDALDALGKDQEALTYYRAANWLGRKEAGVVLLLGLSFSPEYVNNSISPNQWSEEADTLIPGSLLVGYAKYILNNNVERDNLIAFGNPRISLDVRRDPRLERLQAEAISKLFQSGVWDESLLQRVLEFRSWQVDLHSFQYGKVQNIAIWEPEKSLDLIQMTSLVKFFEYLNLLIPNHGVSKQLDEVYLRLEKQGVIRNSSPDLRLLYKNDRKMIIKDFDECSQELNDQSGKEFLLRTDLSRWWSSGQAINISSSPAGNFGYSDVPAGWVVGPDTYDTYCGQPVFREKCTWVQANLENAQPIMFSTVVNPSSGEILNFSVDPGKVVLVDVLWKGDKITFKYLGSATPIENDFVHENGWHQTNWKLYPIEGSSEVNVGWVVEGCGDFRLSNLNIFEVEDD